MASLQSRLSTRIGSKHISQLLTDLEEDDYLEIDHDTSKNVLYIKCWNGIPATNYITINTEEGTAITSGKVIDAKDCENVYNEAERTASITSRNDLSLDPETKIESQDKSETYTVFGYVGDQVRLIKIRMQEEVNELGYSALTTSCTDMLNGTDIRYANFVQDNYPHVS